MTQTKSCYDPELDDRIFEIIDKNGETQFNTLVKLLNKTPRTISKHLDFLTYEKNLLNWTRNRPGEKGSIKLTKTAEIKRKYTGYFKIDYSNKKGICKEGKTSIKNEKEKDRKRKIILFLLLALAHGYSEYKVSSNHDRGNFIILGPDGKSLKVSTNTKKGFSLPDLDRKDFKFSDIHKFLYFNRFTKKEAEEAIKQIDENKDIPLKKIYDENNEIRYEIENDLFKDFLIWCCNILEIIVEIMYQYWFILSKKPKPEECEWFYFIMGDEVATYIFQKIETNKTKRKTIKDLYTEYHFEFVDEKLVEKFIKYIEYCIPNIFSINGMKDAIFTRSSNALIQKNYCKHITPLNERWKELLDSKYQFIFEDLMYIINPDFIRKRLKKYSIKIIN